MANPVQTPADIDNRIHALVAQIPPNLMASGRTLAIHMYALSSESLNVGPAYATGVVLLVVVAGINMLSAQLAKKIAKGGTA